MVDESCRYFLAAADRAEVRTAEVLLRMSQEQSAAVRRAVGRVILNPVALVSYSIVKAYRSTEKISVATGRRQPMLPSTV